MTTGFLPEDMYTSAMQLTRALTEVLLPVVEPRKDTETQSAKASYHLHHFGVKMKGLPDVQGKPGLFARRLRARGWENQVLGTVKKGVHLQPEGGVHPQYYPVTIESVELGVD